MGEGVRERVGHVRGRVRARARASEATSNNDHDDDVNTDETTTTRGRRGSRGLASRVSVVVDIVVGVVNGSCDDVVLVFGHRLGWIGTGG